MLAAAIVAGGAYAYLLARKPKPAPVPAPAPTPSLPSGPRYRVWDVPRHAQAAEEARTGREGNVYSAGAPMKLLTVLGAREWSRIDLDAAHDAEIMRRFNACRPRVSIDDVQIGRRPDLYVQPVPEYT